MAALTSELDLDQVLNTLLVHLEKVIPYEIAFVLLREGKTLYLKASKGLSHQELVDRFSVPFCQYSINFARYEP